MKAKKCDECAERSAVYRQCPRQTCKHEIAYCAQHGGDDRAQPEMTAHIVAHS